MATKWIYVLKKEELQEELQRYGLEDTGTVEELRKRMVDFYTKVTTLADKEESVDTAASAEKPSAETTPAQLCEMIRKWNVHYDGKTDPIMFRERLTELQTSYGITGDRLLTALPELLRGNAILWYRNNKDCLTTWDTFIAEFEKYFIPDKRYHYEEQIRQRMHRPGETGQDYITELQTLMRRHGGYSPEEQLYRLYKNLRPEYRQRIRRQDCPTVNALLEEIRELEELQKELKASSRRNQETVPQKHVPSSHAVVVDVQQACWRCGEKGHFRNNCKNAPQIFCSRCGKRGVLSRNCCRPENSKPTGTTGGSTSRPQGNTR